MVDDDEQNDFCSPPVPMWLFSHEPHDAKLIVKTKPIPVHKNYLSLVSPVFKAMFKHDTKESETLEIVIDDFEFDIVDAAIDYIYGSPLPPKAYDWFYYVYLFFDKYNITAASKQLVSFFNEDVNVYNFSSIVRYAKTFEQPVFMDRCISFIAQNISFTMCSSFIKLEQDIIMELLQKASIIFLNQANVEQLKDK